MDYNTISTQRVAQSAIITLSRVQRLNAFTSEMGTELLDVLDECDANDAIRTIIITGEGRAFCAGADLEGGASTFDFKEAPGSVHEDEGGVLALRLFRSQKPIIGAINGPAVGIGVTMTLPMDIRICSDEARFGFVFTRRGVVPEAASSWFLPRIVGISQALEWVLSGRVFSPEEALAGGLVRSIHRGGSLIDTALELGREIATQTAPVSVAMARAMLWGQLSVSHPSITHDMDSEAMTIRGRSPDAAEGISAFLAKRPANFPDKVSEGIANLSYGIKRTHE